MKRGRSYRANPEAKSFRVVQQGSPQPGGTSVFAPLSVLENLRMGAFSRGADKGVEEDSRMGILPFPVSRNG
ncbi:hypothetical protein MASR2M17_13170 [Aminivibrio sp.]